MAKLERLKRCFGCKKVFLTGHTGFKGSWLLQILSLADADLKGYALPPGGPGDLDGGDWHYDVIGGDTLCQSVIADIRDVDRLTDEIVQFQPDYLFHLAAQSLVRPSYREPLETFAVNAMGTVHVLEALRALDQPCAAVIVTTDKVYENRELQHPFRECDPLGGHDPYSASKAMAEIVAQSYRSSFFCRDDDSREHGKAIATARAGNVIGGGDYAADRIIPDIVRAMRAGEPVAVRNPTAIRPWQHVLEPLAGYLELAARLAEDGDKLSGAWNFGPRLEDTLSVEQIVQIALECWGSGEYETPELKNQPHEAGTLKLDISKATDALNWAPKLSAAEAIDWTIRWYREPSAEMSLDQVQAYLSL